MLLCFLVSGKVAKVLHMLFFFPNCLGFVGWFILVYLGLEGLGIFVFLVFVFLLFSYCFFVFVLLFDCFWCCSCFFCFFVFVFGRV